MRGPSPYALIALAGVSFVLSVAVESLSLPVPAAKGERGDLDRIAADGVTEQGGSPVYARMLTRTGSDGRLSATLLPPVADWASQPIANLYYAAGNAPTQGNGSPQYPFNTLTYALSHMAADSALLLAPATYSGTLSLASGRTVTLVGFGPGAYVSSLTVTASGSSSSTCLALFGLRVGTLSLAGGTVNLRLAGSTVAQLQGTASTVTVTRMDLGSTIGVSTLAHVDAYAGYDTVPKANALTTPTAATRLTLVGGRAVVADGGATHTVAYLSDVAGATNGTYTAIRGLQDADTALSGRIDAEAAARAAGDTANSNRLVAARAELEAQMALIGTTWGEQLSTLNTIVNSVQSGLQALRTQEASDVNALNSSISGVQTGYLAADAGLSSRIDSLDTTVGELESRFTAIADERAVLRANNAASAVSSELAQAMASGDAALRNSINATAGSVTSLGTRVTTLEGNSSSQASSIASLSSTVSSLQGTVSSLSSDTASWRSSVDSSIGTLNTWKGDMNSWKTTMNIWKTDTTNLDSQMKAKINEIISCLQAIKSGGTWTAPATLP